MSFIIEVHKTGIMKINNPNLLHRIHFPEKWMAYMDFSYIIVLY